MQRFAIRKDTLFLYCRVQTWILGGGLRGRCKKCTKNIVLGSKITRIRDCTFQRSRKITDFCQRLPAGAKWFAFHPFASRTAPSRPPKKQNTSLGAGRRHLHLSSLCFQPAGIRDAGIAIYHSRGYIISILQGPEMSWRGCTSGGHTQKLKISVPIHPFTIV